MNSEKKLFLILVCLGLWALAGIISFIIFDWSLWVFGIVFGTWGGAFVTALFVMHDRKRKKTWQLFASEVGAELTACQSEKMRFQTKRWTVCVEMFNVGQEVEEIHTVARAEYLTDDGLKFRVRRKRHQCFGMQDLESSAFDQEFAIGSSGPTKVDALFSGPTIRQLMLQQAWVSLEARPSANSFELYLENKCAIDNIDELRGLSELFGLMLERLSSGSQTGTPSSRQP